MSHNIRGNPTTQTVTGTASAVTGATQAVPATVARGVPAAATPPVAVLGAAHWPHPPAPSERCALAARPGWQGTLGMLAALLDRPYRWPDPIAWDAAQPQRDPDDNPAIPAGYTYLLQFVAHDMVNTSPPLWAADPAVGSANLRHRRLMLDTLYGDGPGNEPGAYATAAPGGADRTHLRLGTLAGIAPGGCPMRDLFRAAVPGQGTPPALNADGCFDVFAADPRNDDNAVISQLTVLFASLHNALVDAIAAQPGVAALPAAVRTERVFAAARGTLGRLVRRVVCEDLLPRLLHPHVLAHHGAGAAPLWDGGALPLEFSHGAMRAGHAMVRDHYFFADGPESDVALADGIAAGAPARVPRGRRWALRWSRFFDFGDSALRPNASRRIGPGMSSSLLVTGLFPAIDGGWGRGLPHRDLVSATLAGLWSGPALVAAIAARAPALLPQGWLFAPGNPAGAAAIAGYLAEAAARHGVVLPAKLGARDLPLPFFILLEAALDPAVRGRHLGLLGSIIVADVLYRALADAEAAAAASALVPPALAGRLGAVCDMPGLVRLTDALAFGPAADPPFV